MIERNFDAAFASALSLREKQIQQSYRPVIGIHKWFARRPGTLFRALLLSEFDGPLGESSYFRGHRFEGVVADPFMGGGTPLIEAVRLGFSVVGCDVNPMAYWIVRQSLAPLDLTAFREAADEVIAEVERSVASFYETECIGCHRTATVKYFLWVKTLSCPRCQMSNDLFPGYLVAESVRHPKNVLVCASCGDLNEFDEIPTAKSPATCGSCRGRVTVEGAARKQRISCRGCEAVLRYPDSTNGVPQHRLFAIEYHCGECKPQHEGRFFKKPDDRDRASWRAASDLLQKSPELRLPDDPIPPGDETDRLHRWGYSRFIQMFSDRQALGLGLLLAEIRGVSDQSVREALLTVFSDTLRYQNMLCRYDTYALKCQDIFSVHGFPVGLVQCENNLLGIVGVGSGGYRHFVEKYLRAKTYCEQPFETKRVGSRKQQVATAGERIVAAPVTHLPVGRGESWLRAVDSSTVRLPEGSLDGVFTDPPYYDNVQYAELMDFCYAWLRIALDDPAFRECSTRNNMELTGNATLNRGLAEFTTGLSAVFSNFAAALKPNAPFVFTYHHNAPEAYLPVVVALLDAGLRCSATLPAAAEMAASLHISGTQSSVLDSVFVCRRELRASPNPKAGDLRQILRRDAEMMAEAGVKVTVGDLRCLASGHVARIAVNSLIDGWNRGEALSRRMTTARQALAHLSETLRYAESIENVLAGISFPAKIDAVSV